MCVKGTSYVSPPLARTKYGTSTRSTPAESIVSQRYGMTHAAAFGCDGTFVVAPRFAVSHIFRKTNSPG